MSSISTRAEMTGREVHQSSWVDHAARIGLATYGMVHLVIAWLAVQLAFGDREGSADSQGAVQKLKEQPFGEALVWAVGIGMFLLALWQALEALFGYRAEEGFTPVRKRVTAAGKAVVYVPLLRVRAEAQDLIPVARTFVVGLPGGMNQRLQPFRLDEMPQTYRGLSQHALD